MNVFSAISRTSAPAAKAFSDPVMTMQRTLFVGQGCRQSGGKLTH